MPPLPLWPISKLPLVPNNHAGTMTVGCTALLLLSLGKSTRSAPRAEVKGTRLIRICWIKYFFLDLVVIV